MTFGSKGRFRERKPLQRLGTFQIGTTITEKYEDGKWVKGVPQPNYATVSNYRYYKFVEKCSDSVHWPGPPYTIGGNFDRMRGLDGGLEVLPLNTGTVYHTGGLYRSTYMGGWMPNWYPPSPFTLKSTFNLDNVGLQDLSSYGPSAYNMYSPTRPRVDLGQFFAEFREIPKMLFNTAKLFKDLYKAKGGYHKVLGPKRVADEFLSYQFGWLPFLGTLIDFHSVMSNLSTEIKRIIKQNGKWERRGGPVENEIVSEDLIYSASSVSKTYPSLSSAFGNTGDVKIYKRHIRQIWYSGFYKYYIPEIKFRTWWQPEILKLILGLRVTPSLLWELTPFSWLFDWFGNIGDMLSNYEQADLYQLVSRNSFLMAKSSIRFDFEANRLSGRPNHAIWSYEFDRKQRVKASPYGFNVRFTDLSARQIGILGALGIQEF